MVLFQDQREKRGHHNSVEDYCEENGIVIVRKRLNVGDYMFPHGKTSIDTKQNLLELASDLYKDKLAFNKKYKKCHQDGIKLIVLVEQPINSMKELLEWKSEHTKITGKQIVDMMHTLKVSYGISFKFCHSNNTGQTVISLLKGEI
jgi:ERCC4-type nuclease